MIELIPVSQQDSFLSMLIYGEPDSGKTTLACSGHDHHAFSKTLIINLERGTKSVRHTTALQTPKLTRSADVEQVILDVRQGVGLYAGIKTLVLDSATELHRILLDEVVSARADKKGLKGIDRDKPEIQDYGASGKRFARICGLMRDLPCNIIWIALAKSTKERDDGPVTGIGPELPNKACVTLTAMADVVFPLVKMASVEGSPAKQGVPEVEAKPEHVLMPTRAIHPYYARSRIEEFKSAPRFIENPTLPQMWDVYAPKKEKQA